MSLCFRGDLEMSFDKARVLEWISVISWRWVCCGVVGGGAEGEEGGFLGLVSREREPRLNIIFVGEVVSGL